jgi:receptor protein-tyrosine kinase
MSIFSKIDKSSLDTVKAGDLAKEKEQESSPPADSNKVTSIRGSVDTKGRNIRELETMQVDIPLNKDLNDEQNQINLTGSDKLDFDFSNLFEDSHDSLRSENEVLSVNPLKSFSHQVHLNLDLLAHKGYVTPNTVNSLLGNTFRMIKRPLINNVQGHGATVVDNANLIMLTSPMEGEGKTFSAINLAISIAMEKDKKVLLVDGDINKPSHGEILGYGSEYGLTDLLTGRVKDMSKVLYRTNIPSLNLMSAGNKTTHANELLASETMGRFAKEVSTFYKDRLIIFDAPPLLLPTEASVLASHMGQVIVVVQAEKTLRHQVKHSLDMLSNKIVLLLLNQSREKSLVGNYGYYKYEDQN